MSLLFRRSRKRLRRNSIQFAGTQVSKPCLWFSPTAWAKLLYLRDCGPTEVGGFAITGKEDLLHVDEIHLVKQVCTEVSVAFDDEAVADFFHRQVDRGLRPEQFGRVWVHTHPGNCALPSSTDEETFDRVFGRSDWALMFILARGGQTYARIRFCVGPGGEVELPTRVDYSREFAASNWPAWRQQYVDSVHPVPREPRMERLMTWEDELLGSNLAWNDNLGLPDEAPLLAPF